MRFWKKKKEKAVFKLSDEDYSLLYVLALGYPAQKSQACDMTDSVKYFEDETKTINVPKRLTKEILIDII